MKKNQLIVVLAVCLPIFLGCFSSCSLNRGFVSSVKRADIEQLSRFEMFNYVGSIEKGNKVVRNDSLTAVAKELFETELAKASTLPVSDTIFIQDSVVNFMVQDEIFYLMERLETTTRVKNVPVPPTIDSILCSQGKRFGLLLYNWGFTRTAGNYAGQVAKGIAIGILSMGAIIPVPYKDMTRSGLVIVDAKNHNIAFVSMANRENSPLKPFTYKHQVKELLWKFK